MTGAPADEPFRLALYSGLYVRRDAISNSVRHKLEVVDRLRDGGVPIEATVFTLATDYADPRVRLVRGVEEVVQAPQLRSAAVHVFEFGIYHALFDCVFLIPEDVPTVAAYHNITPPELASEGQREVIARSLAQKHNLFRCHHVMCDSEYNRRDLLAFGIPPERLSVVPLPPARRPGSPAPHRGSGPVRLLYVGRFVEAKGVLDLVRAAARLVQRGGPPFLLTLAGNVAMSSPAVLDEIRALCGRDRLDEHVRVCVSPDDDALAALYAESDALVMPSYHEGYCVPVVEALSSGCHVIAYDSSNLPLLLEGLGQLVPTGDVAALTDALARYVERRWAARADGAVFAVPTAAGDVPERDWRRTAAALAATYSESAYERRFLAVLATVAQALPGGAPPWLSGARDAVTAGAS